MRECDIHQTRYIKTNSAINLSHKPGLDLGCELLQHLHGVLRICTNTFQLFAFSFLKCVDFARPITQIVFHMKLTKLIPPTTL